MSAMPTPSSLTVISTLLPSVLMPHDMVAPSSEYLQAFDSRLVIIDSNFHRIGLYEQLRHWEWNTVLFPLLFS